MRGRWLVLALTMLGACSFSDASSTRDADYLDLFFTQQRLRQQLFVQQMQPTRLVQCLPEGFAVVCR